MTALFGLSLRSEEQCAFSPERLPDFCRCLELPGTVLDTRAVEAWSSSCRDRGIDWGVRDLLDPALARTLTEADERVRFEALRKLGERAETAFYEGAKWASLDLDVSAAVNSAVHREKLYLLLRQTGGMIFRIAPKLKLLLPVRIPPPPGGGADPTALLGFCHDLPLPGMHLVFEVHPHEPGALDWKGGEGLRFESRTWRVCFNPSSGNYLKADVLHRFFGDDDLPPEPLRVLFSPEGCVPDEFLFSQLAKAVYTV